MLVYKLKIINFLREIGKKQPIKSLLRFILFEVLINCKYYFTFLNVWVVYILLQLGFKLRDMKVNTSSKPQNKYAIAKPTRKRFINKLLH